MGKSYKETLKELMKDPEFKKEWDALEPEYQLMCAILDGRKEAKLTQKELSEATGITQADISRLESGEANPSLQTLKRLAAGMGKKLQIKFI